MALFNNIQAYSEPCIYAEIWHIGNARIFRTLPKLHPTHMQNPVIFTKIVKPYVTLGTESPDILTILTHM